MTWSSFLGLSSATGPNGDTGSIGYDANARPGTTTSPYGAVTNYTYNDTASPPNKIATTDGHWVKTVMDGFGRTIQTITGYGSTTVSTVDTKYAPCGCSPLGKLSQQSQPYAPGGSDAWTTYSYDASGRTLTTVLPEGSTTTYLYQGNDVYVWDPAGNWKVFAMDAFGNLAIVGEPDPTLGNVWSYYVYDVLNHLTTVSLVRGSNTQTRTFNYNNPANTVTAYLQSATNPENGTVSYTYNAGTNTLASKTDALSHTLTYQYDSYNRLTSVTLSPSTLLRTYYYDTNPLDTTGFSQNIQGRLAAVKYPAFPGTSIQMNDMYSYTQAGLSAAKRLQVNETATVNLDASYTYNLEGKMTSVTYPNSGPSYNYSYDSMYRLSGMTQSSTTIVNNVSYNAANQMLTMNYSGLSESRIYNGLNQLTNITAGSENLTYTYPTGTNNGKVSSMYNATSGETVSYAYESLNRLLTASGSTSGITQWGQSYVYDAFGNLLQKKITAGSPPSLSQGVNPSNNQIVGQTYDNNGNTSYATTGGLTYNLFYDAENRMNMVYYSPMGQTTAQYGYDAQNHRIWISTGAKDPYGNPTYLVNFYSPDGQKLATYTFVYYGSTLGVTVASSDQYFGSRRLAAMDQLGSVGNYFPWGEDKGGTSPQNTWNFATYWRDSASGLDYANNRYYSNAYGRFMTPDPFNGSSKPSNPQSWNRYNYGGGDPVNNNDPSGLDEGPPTLVCTIGAGVFYGEICYGFYGSITFSPLSGYFASSNISAAIAAAEEVAQEYLSIWTTTSQARSLLSAKLQSQAVSSNSDCMGFLESQTGKSFNQLMQDANTISYDDVTGPGGNLTMDQLGVPGQDYSSDSASAFFSTRPSGTVATTLSSGNGTGLVLLSSSFFNSNYGLGGPTVPTTSAYQQGVLFHEFFHVEGIGDLGGSVAFNNWVQGGCNGDPPGN